LITEALFGGGAFSQLKIVTGEGEQVLIEPEEFYDGQINYFAY
jgi:hypothetical protein